MKKLMIAALLLISACEKTPAEKANYNVAEFCKADPKSKGYDCQCQADMIDEELADDEMVTFSNFLQYAKSPDPKPEIKEDFTKMAGIFVKISKLGPTIKDKCKE